jgi:hypothetical protein
VNEAFAEQLSCAVGMAGQHRTKQTKRQSETFLGSKDGNAAAEKGGKANLFNFSLSAFAGGEGLGKELGIFLVAGADVP